MKRSELKNIIQEYVLELVNEDLRLYHTYFSKSGFDANKYDFERGLFALRPWWVGKPGYEKYSAFHPNEFGDKVVELTIDDNVKTFKSTDQIDLIAKYFPNSKAAKSLVQKYENGDFQKEDWQQLDTFIGKFLLKQGYKLIHYTQDAMYGDVWVILDKSIIKRIRHEEEPL
jgi:hypothetical protein